MEGVGQTLFYLAIVVGAVAGLGYLSGLVWMLAEAVRHRGVRRPMWLNYAALAAGLAVPTMVIGLVLSGRLAWWFLILFAPFIASRSVLFRMGSSVSKRTKTSQDHT